MADACVLWIAVARAFIVDRTAFVYEHPLAMISLLGFESES